MDECGRERKGESSAQPIKPPHLLSLVSLCFLQLIEEDGSRSISAASWGWEGVKVFSYRVAHVSAAPLCPPFAPPQQRHLS